MKFIQLSDTHIFENQDEIFTESNPYKNFKKTIKAIKEDFFDIDFLILSGDLSQDHSVKSYEYIKESMDLLDIKYYIFPGNHDHIDNLNKAFNSSIEKDHADFHFIKDNWLFYTIDSTVTPAVNGEFSPMQIEKLSQALEEHSSKNAILLMHHQPIPVKSAWIDRLGMRESDQEKLKELTLKYKNIRAMLFGHIHYEFEESENGVLYLGCPSTIYQTKAYTPEFELDKTCPGFRVVNITDSSIKTNVIYLS